MKRVSLAFLFVACPLAFAEVEPISMTESLNASAKAYSTTAKTLSASLDAAVSLSNSYETVKNQMTEGDRREFNAALLSATNWFADAEDKRSAAQTVYGKQSDCWKLGQLAGSIPEMNAWFTLGNSYGVSVLSCCSSADAKVSNGLYVLGDAAQILAPYLK